MTHKRPQLPGEVWIHIDGRDALSRPDGRVWAVQWLGHYVVVQRFEIRGRCDSRYDGPQSDHPRAYLVVQGTVDVDAGATLAVINGGSHGETENTDDLRDTRRVRSRQQRHVQRGRRRARKRER